MGNWDDLERFDETLSLLMNSSSSSSTNDRVDKACKPFGKVSLSHYASRRSPEVEIRTYKGNRYRYVGQAEIDIDNCGIASIG